MKYLLTLILLLVTTSCDLANSNEVAQKEFLDFCGYDMPTEYGQTLYFKDGTEVYAMEDARYRNDTIHNNYIDIRIFNTDGDDKYVDCRMLSSTKPGSK